MRQLCGERLLIAFIGGLAGVLLTLPLAAAFASTADSLSPVSRVSVSTMVLQMAAAALVGVVAAPWPS